MHPPSNLSRSPSVESRPGAGNSAAVSTHGRTYIDSRQSVSPTWGGSAAYAALPPAESPATAIAFGTDTIGEGAYNDGAEHFESAVSHGALFYAGESTFTTFVAAQAHDHHVVHKAGVGGEPPTPAAAVAPRTMTPGRASALAAATAAASSATSTIAAPSQEPNAGWAPIPLSQPASTRESLDAGSGSRYEHVSYALPVDIVAPGAPSAGSKGRGDDALGPSARLGPDQQPPPPEPHPISENSEHGLAWTDQMRRVDAVTTAVMRAAATRATKGGSTVHASQDTTASSLRPPPRPQSKRGGSAMRSMGQAATNQRRTPHAPRHAAIMRHALPLPLPAELRAVEAECARLRMLVALQRDQRLRELADAHAAHERARTEWAVAQAAAERAQLEALETRDAQITDLRMRLVEALRELAERDAAAAAAEEQQRRELEEQRSGLTAATLTRRELMARARIRDHREARLNAYRSPDPSVARSPPRRLATPTTSMHLAEPSANQGARPHQNGNTAPFPGSSSLVASDEQRTRGAAADAVRAPSFAGVDSDELALAELAALEAEMGAATAMGPSEMHLPHTNAGRALILVGASSGVAAALTPAHEPLYVPAPPVLADSHTAPPPLSLASSGPQPMTPAGLGQPRHTGVERALGARVEQPETGNLQLQRQVEHWKQIALRLAAGEGH